MTSGNTNSCGCYHKDLVSKLNYKDLTGQKFGKVTAICPTDNRCASGAVKWFCVCECGNEIITSSHSLLHGDTVSCGCKMQSIAVDLIEKILQENNIKYIKEKTFEDLINPETNGKLRYDFYIPSYNYCIEYDGQHHYKPIKAWGGEDAFNKIQYRDSIKNNYCKNNNIGLIRIPYTYKDITLEDILPGSKFDLTK